MCNEASAIFDSSQPRPPDRFWWVGQRCFHRFNWDKRWYRAEVVKVHRSQVEVRLVDYGTMQLAEHKDLRSDVMFEDVPVSVASVYLDELYPKVSLSYVSQVTTKFSKRFFLEVSAREKLSEQEER